MKNTVITIFASVILIAGLITGYILIPEGKVIEYRPDYSYAGRYNSGGLRIQIVVENGIDNYIPCDGFSIQQVNSMCDSLNKRLK